jgi:hypothetical protein
MKKVLFAFLVLFAVIFKSQAQDLQPLRIEIEYNQDLWLEAEYAISLSTITIAPSVFVGNLSTTDVDFGIQARVYPFSNKGIGFYGTVAGIYDYHYSVFPYTNLDIGKIGIGYRLIHFKIMTGNIGIGWAMQSDSTNTPNSIYLELGLGVALGLN